MRFLTIATIMLCLVSAMGILTACGGGGGKSSGPISYEPILRYPDPERTEPYFNPDYIKGITRVTSSDSIWRQYYPYSSYTYLTPAGLHREDLCNHGRNWLVSHFDSHITGEPGTIAIAPQDFVFTYGTSYNQTKKRGPVYLSAIGDNQAYVTYGIRDIPEGYSITNVTATGEWTYVDMEATGGLRIGLSKYSEDLRDFTDYMMGGDIYHPLHWKYTSEKGITQGPGGTTYIFIMLHGGLEARIDGLTVTIEYIGY